MSLRKLTFTFVTGFIVFGLLVVAINILTRDKVVEIGTQWELYDEGPASKSDYLNSLRGAIGFGGVLHEFNNFLLRKNRPRLVRVHRE